MSNARAIHFDYDPASVDNWLNAGWRVCLLSVCSETFGAAYTMDRVIVVAYAGAEFNCNLPELPDERMPLWRAIDNLYVESPETFEGIEQIPTGWDTRDIRKYWRTAPDYPHAVRVPWRLPLPYTPGAMYVHPHQHRLLTQDELAAVWATGSLELATWLDKVEAEFMVKNWADSSWKLLRHADGADWRYEFQSLDPMGSQLKRIDLTHFIPTGGVCRTAMPLHAMEYTHGKGWWK